jgi:cytochrome c oxidase subunit II
MRRNPGAVLLLALLPAGCGRTNLSAANPAGPQAERIETLMWTMTALGTAVFVAVVAMLLYATWRGRRRVLPSVSTEDERQMTRWVVGAVGVSALILIGVLVANLGTGRAMASFAERDALTIKVVAKQWWWQVEYLDPRPYRRVLTANEIHIPVGRRIRLVLESHDVIHSFWAPNLLGKVDMIPGYRRVTYFEADREGMFEGRCAEFCGHQHARMQFRVFAQPEAEFEAWYEGQLRPAEHPRDPVVALGQQIFLQKGCVLCHQVRGTLAGSRFGPDLTHIASRTTLAAGTIPNTRGHLGGWIVDPQKIKPMSHMPPNAVTGDELQALLAYMESLR